MKPLLTSAFLLTHSLHADIFHEGRYNQLSQTGSEVIRELLAGS